MDTRSWKDAERKLFELENEDFHQKQYEKLSELLDKREVEAYQKLIDSFQPTHQYQVIGPGSTITAAAPPSKPKEDVTIDYAIERFMKDCAARKLHRETQKKFRQLTDKLSEFSKRKGFNKLSELNYPDIMAAFRESWPWSARTANPMVERLRQFFDFCGPNGRRWIDHNPALALKLAKVNDSPTLPYTPEEIEKMLWGCEIYSTAGKYRSNNRKRMRAMVLLQRWSGLSIMDAATLERSRLNDENQLMLYRAKTGEPVFVELPPDVAAELGALESPNPKYFFWSGEGRKESAVKVWDESYTTLFRIAGIEKKGNNNTSHRMRDTFAIEFLNAGGELHELQMLLGHSSIRTTERHYAPWVKSRQKRLSEAVRRTWA